MVNRKWQFKRTLELNKEVIHGSLCVVCNREMKQEERLSIPCHRGDIVLLVLPINEA